MSTGVYYFRKDWRIHDNPLLARACAECDQIIYLWTSPAWDGQGHAWSTGRMSDQRRRFVRECIDDLREELADAGAQLVVRFGDPVEVLQQLSKEHPFDRLYGEELPGTEEVEEWNAIASFALDHGVQVYQQWQRTLLSIADLPFGMNHLPKVFTSFRTKVEQQWRVREGVAIESWPKCMALPSHDWPTIAAISAEFDPRASLNFVGGAKKGYERVLYYCASPERLGIYKETRNGLIGADYSSKFSPWLAWGCVSPVEVYEAIMDYEDEFGGNDSSYWLVFELLWRDFFQFTARKEGRRIFMRNGFGEGVRLKSNGRSVDEKRWKEGQTGHAFVDACMRELVATGYMSNRGRQNAASYLVHDLAVDWRIGASFFEYHLLDYDVASNWCNWAYIAGVGNDPRAGRKFNVDKQASDYDPKQTFRKLWA